MIRKNENFKIYDNIYYYTIKHGNLYTIKNNIKIKKSLGNGSHKTSHCVALTCAVQK